MVKEGEHPHLVPYLNDIERDRYNPPSPHLLKQFASVLHLSREHLLFLAGAYPNDLRGVSYEAPVVEAAFEAFWRVLQWYPDLAHHDLSADHHVPCSLVPDGGGQPTSLVTLFGKQARVCQTGRHKVAPFRRG